MELISCSFIQIVANNYINALYCVYFMIFPDKRNKAYFFVHIQTKYKGISLGFNYNFIARVANES